MSKPVAVAWRETADELRERYVAERDIERRKRLQALWLVRRGAGPAEAGRLAGAGARTVERWLGWYRGGGLDEVLRRVPGHGTTGPARRLSAEQERSLVAACAEGRFRTCDEAREWIAAEYGVAYRYGGFWTVLARLGVHPKVPRPVAEQADAAAQEAWQQGG
jgi:transposase